MSTTIAVRTVHNYSDSPRLVLTVNEDSWSLENNTSTVSWTYKIERPQPLISQIGKAYSIVINGEVVKSGNVVMGGSGTMTVATGTETITHNADGTKTISCGFDQVCGFNWHGTTAPDASIRQNITLTRIPQIPVVTNMVYEWTETTCVIQWTSSEQARRLWYSVQPVGGTETWSSAFNVSGTSGSYTITGLTAATNYMIKTKIESIDLYEGTAPMTAFITRDYPYASNLPNFTIGDNVTFFLHNPLRRSVTIKLFASDNALAKTITANSDGNVTMANDATMKTVLYNSIPSSQSAYYHISVIYSTNTKTTGGSTYSIKTSECLPTISTVTYQDTNSTVTAITGNNQQIVRNQSIVQFTATGITTKYSATISNARVSVNSHGYTMTVSGSSATGGNTTINSAYNLTATVTDRKSVV